MRNNIILNTDSYKQTHHLMEVPGTETVYSYFESRELRIRKIKLQFLHQKGVTITVQQDII